MAVSVWPQSGQADLARLGLSLLSDQEKEEEKEETVGDCPPGLYWCRDTCYSHSVCYQSPQSQANLLTDTNLISGMFQDSPSLSNPDQRQGVLKLNIIGPSYCKVGEETEAVEV